MGVLSLPAHNHSLLLKNSEGDGAKHHRSSRPRDAASKKRANKKGQECALQRNIPAQHRKGRFVKQRAVWIPGNSQLERKPQ